MSAFDELCSPLQEALLHRGWKSLHDIQERSFPEIASGKNVMIVASTAGGKTEAAFLPLLNRFYQSPESGVKILYVAPLRALLNNIENRLIEYKLCESVYLDVFKWHGDVARSKKLSAVRRSVDVLLTTPESLDVILCSSYIDEVEFFKPLDAVIVDETHFFAGSDRGAQLVSVLNRLQKTLDRDLQRICLSATVGNAAEVLSWVCGPSRRVQITVQAPPDKRERDVQLNYYPPDQDSLMAESIVQGSLGVKTIVFEPSRKQAEARSRDFASRVSVCHVHHSSVDKFWREEAERELFETKHSATVIATCTLELGIDVGDLDLIQQEGSFPSVSSYLQRIGRTGRVRPPQRCHAHVTDEVDFLKNLAIITLADEGFVEKSVLPTNYYHLLLQQLLMLCISNNGYPISEAKRILQDCAPLSGISSDDFDELVDHWITTGVFRTIDDFLLMGFEVEHRYARTNFRDLYVLFQSPQTFEVWYGSTAIGTLDLLFVRTRRSNFSFILAGRWWQVEDVDFNASKIFVKPIRIAPPPPDWRSSRGYEISYPVAQQIKRLLLSQNIPSCLKRRPAIDLLSSLRNRAFQMGLRDTQFQLHKLPNGRWRITTYAGHRVNLLIAELQSRYNGWVCDERGFESITFSATANSQRDFEQPFCQLVRRIKQDDLLKDRELLSEVADPYDDPNVSKWSGWLPKKYRVQFLIHELFDIRSTLQWLASIET